MKTTRTMKAFQLALCATSLLLVLGQAEHARAHCQVPCGIYDDAARIKSIREDITTIEKAMGAIAELAPKRDAQSQNQLVRWINTKEAHADKIIHVIAEYFLTQKIKPVAPGQGKAYAAYVEQLTRHHAVMVAAMKTKQTAGTGAPKELKQAVDAIAGYWK